MAMKTVGLSGYEKRLVSKKNVTTPIDVKANAEIDQANIQIWAKFRS